MTAFNALAAASARRLKGTLAALVLILALGMGTALTAFTSAWRTQHAYPDYLRRAGVSEVVVNPSLVTDRIDEVIRSTPGVIDVVSDSLLVTTVDDGTPRTQADLDRDRPEGVLARLSTDGRYERGDRPIVHRGRTVRTGNEAFLNREAAEALDLRVGDEIPLAFWTAGYTDVANRRAIVEPIGRKRVTVVGIGAFADEVLADDLYPRRRVLVTSEVAAPFDCIPSHPSEAGEVDLDRVLVQLAPAGCATAFRYYSLRVSGGEDGVAAVTGALSERFQAENARLPAVLEAQDLQFRVISTVTREERRRVQQSLGPSVTALVVFGTGAAVSVLVISALVAVRGVRRMGGDLTVWQQLGAIPTQVKAAVAAPLFLAGSAGLLGALGIAWLASAAGPVASARVVEPGVRFGVPALVALAVLGGGWLAVCAGAPLIAALNGPRRAARPRPPSRLAELASRTGRIGLAEGTRAVTGSNRPPEAATLLTGTTACVVAVIATTVFSANLGRMVSEPERYGWPYDVGAMVGYGYGGADRDVIAAQLDDPEVASWALAALGGVDIEGEALPGIAPASGRDDLAIPVVAGRLPTAADEIALGARSADRLGLAVGDETTVTTAYGTSPAKVTGLVVLPSVGPFLADRVTLGTGVLLSAPFFDTVVEEAGREAGLAPGELRGTLDGFVAIRLRPGVDAEAWLAAQGADLAGWDKVLGSQPFLHTDPVRPPQIADAAAMRAAPTVLGGFLGATMATALGVSIALAVHARRRDLAVLRALGASSGQVRSTVLSHACLVVLIALCVGVPVGWVVGRWSWQAFASGLGIVASTDLTVGWTLAAAATAIGLAFAVSLPSAFVASRVRPAAELLTH